MLISHQHRFIFLKTSKTAGTSVEIALSKFLGPKDVITPIQPREDEEIREKLGYRSPQNYQWTFRSHPRARMGALFSRKQPQFYNHIPASEVRPLLPDEVWNGYYKFCFERNPWDRFISYYFFKYRTEPRPSFLEAIEAGALKELLNTSRGIYRMDGKIVVDHVARYENLEAELAEVCRKVGIPEKPSLPRVKSSFRPKVHYRELLGENEREQIRAVFREEIETFGYKF